MNENRNLLLAVLLSAAVLFGWEYFIARPQLQTQQAQQALLAHQEKKPATADTTAPQAQAAAAHLSRAQALKLGGARIAIETPTVDGSLLLKGARFDDLRLKHYRETVDPKSPEIVLLSPESTNYPYFAMFGWTADPAAHLKLPDNATPWKETAGTVLSPGHPITLSWDNGQGLVFTRTIAVDDQYLFTVSDSVSNRTAAAVTLYPYAYVARDGVPASTHYSALHEGFVGIVGGDLNDPSYDDVKPEKPPVSFHSSGGWVGITDKYWMAAVVPPQNQAFDGAYRASQPAGIKTYQADYRLNAMSIAPGARAAVSQRLFAGAKLYSILEDYETRAGIPRFRYAIDWGWFFFFTKPMFLLLHLFNGYTGNFGIAILLLTVVIRLLFFPLANTQFKSMSRMKKLQPQVEALKARFAEDRVRQQQEMMELYKREKVNPVSGCLPVVIQIPVFFSLYKVLIVTIEMRHAPFFGWIHDLSAPDPTSILNLFGLLPFDPHLYLPSFLAFASIGIWPILMGGTQWLQMKMNPAPADPVQARMFAFMPIVFTMMLAQFPVGLVIYYTWSNLLSLAQQYFIMRRQGVEIHLFNNLKIPALVQRLARTKPEAGE
jgi:YidC/Oxa1 family membrane protein insertase